MSGVAAAMALGAALVATPDRTAVPDAAAIEAAIANGAVPVQQAQRDGTVRVTFVWRGADTDTVELDWPAWTPDRLDNRLERRPGTDLWTKSVVLPAGTRLSYRLVPDVGISPAADREAYRAAFRRAARPDPLNPRLWDAGGDSGPMSVLELPGAPAQPWLAPRADSPKGAVEVTRLASAIFSNSREIAIYRPANGNRPQRLVILFDGERYRREVPLPTILDNLIAAGAIPPTAAIFVSNPSPEARGKELACNPDFTRFLTDELLPWAASRLAVPDEARHIVLAGASYGGLAAACAALDRPDRFGAVLSQSGSFWWAPGPGQSARAVPPSGLNWVASEIEKREHLPIRFYVEAGALEAQGKEESIRATGRALFEVLRRHGYEALYREPAAGHDWFSWRGTVADGLLFVLRD